jgi:sporulation protein YlmC with PRC-barrel domain
MNTNYRKTLIAAAVAALISTPAWSATDAPGSSTDAAKSRDSQSQSQDAYSRSGDSRSVDGASRAGASNNPLYTRTPDDLSGMEVIGSDGESIGKVKAVVIDRSRDDVHAVISSGGILGIGAREVLVPLAELKLVDDDKLQASLTKETVASRPEYKAEQYGVLESDRRISDFSAFEPTTSPENQTSPRSASDTPSSTTGVESSRTDDLASEQISPRAGSDMPSSATGVERSRPGGADDMPSQMSSRSEMSANPLHRRTPKDLQGMEVIGSDGEKIGKVKAIVASKNRDQVHAVISSGGFLGLGTREILVSLDELKVAGDKQLQADFTQDAVESRPEYQSREYGELESDRPISEFSAFEPMNGKDDPAAKDRTPAQRY